MLSAFQQRKFLRILAAGNLKVLYSWFPFFADGRVPEWLKGTGCKPVGYAYLGSNPSAPTICLCSSGVEHFLGKEEAIGSNPITGSSYNSGALRKGPLIYIRRRSSVG